MEECVKGTKVRELDYHGYRVEANTDKLYEVLVVKLIHRYELFMVLLESHLLVGNLESKLED